MRGRVGRRRGDSVRAEVKEFSDIRGLIHDDDKEEAEEEEVTVVWLC